MSNLEQDSVDTSSRGSGSSPYYLAASVVAFLGLLGTFIWFIGMTLSITSLSLVAAGRWIRHKPLEGAGWAALVMGSVGLAAQLLVLLVLTPTSAVVE